MLGKEDINAGGTGQPTQRQLLRYTLLILLHQLLVMLSQAKIRLIP